MFWSEVTIVYDRRHYCKQQNSDNIIREQVTSFLGPNDTQQELASTWTIYKLN